MKSIILTVLLVLSMQVAKSQETIPLGNEANSKGVFIVIREYPHGAVKLRLLNPLTGDQKDYLDLRQVGYQTPEVALSEEGKHVFSLEVKEGSSVFPPLNSSRIVRYDTSSDERTVMFSRKNMVDFALSPDYTAILVHYYPDEITVIDNSTVGLGQWCIVSLKTNDDSCDSIPFTEKIPPDKVFWVGNEKLAYISQSGDSIRLVNDTTFITDTIALPKGVYADRLLPIKNSEDILIHLSPVDATGNCKLLTLKMPTNEIHPIADLACSSTITLLSISIHTRTLVIGYAGRPALIIDLSTGHVLKELPSLLGMEWNNVQWLDETYEAFVIGQLYYKGKPIATAIFDPMIDSALNIMPIAQDEVVLAVP